MENGIGRHRLWFGNHVISFDNMRLTYSGISGNYGTPAVPNTSGFPGSTTALGSPVASLNSLTLRGRNLPEMNSPTS